MLFGLAVYFGKSYNATGHGGATEAQAHAPEPAHQRDAHAANAQHGGNRPPNVSPPPNPIALCLLCV